MKNYDYIYSAIRLQVVYLNALTAGLLAGLLSSADCLLSTQTPNPEALNFIKPPEMAFRPKRLLHNKPLPALWPPNPSNLSKQLHGVLGRNSQHLSGKQMFILGKSL